MKTKLVKESLNENINDFIEDVKLQMQILYDYDMPDERADELIDMYKVEVTDAYKEKEDPYETARTILSYDDEDWEDNMDRDDD
jgi:hypothetical protein